MTQQPQTAVAAVDSLAAAPKPANKRQLISVEEIAESFQNVSKDIAEIGKLSSEEKTAVTTFLLMLKSTLEPVASAVPISTAIIPIDYGSVTQAHVQPSGQLLLEFENGGSRLVDLSDPRNRDLMMEVMDDFVPKFEALTLQILEERLRKPQPAAVLETPKVEIEAPALIVAAIEEPEPLPGVAVEDAAPEVEPEPAIEAQPTVELPLLLAAPPELLMLPAPTEPPLEMLLPAEDNTPTLPTERDIVIQTVTTETLTYLDMLGSEVFEQEPVSKYFDDWMVNLRQVILSYESTPEIGADADFSAECNMIFGHVQNELDNRIANEEEIAVSYRTLVENRYLLNKIDEEHAAQTRKIVEKGASNIELLMRDMQTVEKELAEAQAVKVSYRHPLQKMAQDQKISDLTQRLDSVKRRLALAVSYSSMDANKQGDIHAQFETQVKLLEEKRKAAMEFLNQNVGELANEIAKLKLTRTSNPIRKVAIQQQVFEAEQKLFEAKKRLELAEKSHSYELERLRAEYEQKKQTTLGEMQTLEQNIATKTVDNSAGVRRDAAKALSEAVRALSARRTGASTQKPSPQEPPTEETAR